MFRLVAKLLCLSMMYECEEREKESRALYVDL